MSFKYGGYFGKLLEVDLSTQKTIEKELPERWIERFVGGRGLGAWILYRKLKPKVDSLSPDNVLVFLSGPLVNTMAPSARGYVGLTKSPQTQGYAYSIAQGSFGQELKATGYDALLIKGASSKPVYLWISDEGGKIKDASRFWGMLTGDTEAYLREDVHNRNAEVACIGPAGENLVKFSSIISGTRRASMGRCGLGAVMGSKKLKAIVAYGTKKTPIAQPELFVEHVAEAFKFLKASRSAKTYRRWGTANLVDLVNELGMLPTMNFQRGEFGGANRINASTLIDSFVLANTHCPRCPIACGKRTLVKQGTYAGELADGPEYETIWAFGPQCGNDRLDVIVAANRLCDDYGLDTISTGNVIGFSMECYEKKIIDKKKTQGIELKFGNNEAMIETIKNIVYKRGIGSFLAEGVKEAARHFGGGSVRFAMHVKGLEMAGYDPRGSKSFGLTYATGSRGGCHHAGGYPFFDEALDKTVDRFSPKGKGLFLRTLRSDRVVYDIGVICVFSRLGLKRCTKLITAVTGLNADTKEMNLIAERISNLERAFNAREDIRKKDDTLPLRLLEEPLTTGGSRGHVVELDELLDDFYEACGWDKTTGVPSEAKLRELGINDVVSKPNKPTHQSTRILHD